MRLEQTEVTASALSRETGIPYPSLDRILKSGEKGKPVKPGTDSIEKINNALVKLGVIEDVREGWAAAGFLVDGYKVVKEAERNPEPPENFDDWPPELRQALAHTRTLTPEAQKYIYKLWLEQSSAHADIEARRQEAERKLEEREKRLRELEAAAGK